jgi:hypothetical protein
MTFWVHGQRKSMDFYDMFDFSGRNSFHIPFFYNYFHYLTKLCSKFLSSFGFTIV